MSVTVVGSLNEDVLVAVGRLPGRGETILARGAEIAPGAKGANQAAAGRLGPGVHMIGRVGADPAGDRQLAALADARVNVSRMHRTTGVPTVSATIRYAVAAAALSTTGPGARGALPEDQQHTAEPAEGAAQPGTGEGGRTPHPQDPAEGAEPDES